MGVMHNLADLVREPGLVDELDIDAIAAVLVEVAALESRLAARLACAVDGRRDDPGERLLDVREASELLKVSADWLRRHPGMPFEVRLGGTVRFSALGVRRWIQAHAGKAA